MGQDSKIEWTHHTFNPWRGCTKVSEGCKNCYAETLSKRNPEVLGEWGPKGKWAIATESYWKQPLRWNRAAEKAGERRRVFCASLADVFEDRPELETPRARLFSLIRQTPALDWLLLTKRPENIVRHLCCAFDLFENELAEARGSRELVNDAPRDGTYHWLYDWFVKNPPSNVWLGTSVEDQATADERIPHLLCVPAVVRFLSCEPLLEAVNIGLDNDNYEPFKSRSTGLHWCIVGGESGPGARPMHPDWARGLRDQCQAAGVPFFFKQWGEWCEHVVLEPVGRIEELAWALTLQSTPKHKFEDGTVVARLGKKSTGRLLDGREWNEFPESAEVSHG